MKFFLSILLLSPFKFSFSQTETNFLIGRWILDSVQVVKDNNPNAIYVYKLEQIQIKKNGKTKILQVAYRKDSMNVAVQRKNSKGIWESDSTFFYHTYKFSKSSIAISYKSTKAKIITLSRDSLIFRDDDSLDGIKIYYYHKESKKK